MITQPTEGQRLGQASAPDAVAALPEGVHTVELVVGDSAGVLRGKRVPATMWPNVLRNGVALANVIFEWSPNCEIRDDAPYSRLTGGVPDVHIHPIVETLRAVPWRPGSARVLCEAVEHGGQPVPIDPRRALKRVLDDVAALGYDVKAAVEIEFHLLDPLTRRPREESLQCYSIERGGLYEEVLAPMRNLITEFGIPIEACNTEYAPGQFEVNVRYGDALTAADMAVQFRNAVKEIATQHGWLATFMPKPYDDLGGSGVHIHQSLWRDGENAFSDGGQLSELGRFYLGGLQRHMPDMTLLGSPTPTAYKRRQDYSFCPTTASWGGDNRTVGLRVIEGDPNAVRIEQRDASADCNPYLALAAQVAAGLDGMRNSIEPGPRCDADGYTTDAAPRLATSVPEAIAALEGSELARATFDPMLLETYAGFCRYEHDAIYGRVSDLERERYMEAY
jgi:glutamine synthetase